jgi:hypothetical protein
MGYVRYLQTSLSREPKDLELTASQQMIVSSVKKTVFAVVWMSLWQLDTLFDVKLYVARSRPM